MADSQGNSKQYGFATFASIKETDRFIKECENSNIVDRGFAIDACKFKDKIQLQREKQQIEEQKREDADPQNMLMKLFALMMNKDIV